MSRFNTYIDREIARFAPYFSEYVRHSLVNPAPTDAKKHRLLVVEEDVHHSYDLYAMLAELKTGMHRTGRLALITRSRWLRWPMAFKGKSGMLAMPGIRDWKRLATLTGFEIVHILPVAHAVCLIPKAGPLLERVCMAVPLLRWISMRRILLLRPIIPEISPPSLSVIIPARNEKGNIENALKRLESWNRGQLEIIFVESHSTDGTWEEIQRAKQLYCERFAIKTFQVSERGKFPAVRKGFTEATGELLVILDADLTMPPELLYQFYDTYASGKADFINGSRLLYPMEGEAMRMLNYAGNLGFVAMLNVILSTRLTDSLCGTKCLRRDDYERIRRWNDTFGQFDPFGDYALLFAAAQLGIGITDVPVRYRARTYGSTNILRFRHGAMLIHMMIVGYIRLWVQRK